MTDNVAALDHLPVGKKRIIICGKAGAGKDFLRHYYKMTCGVPVDVSYTTRTMRPGECDGVHYRYVTMESFDLLLAKDAFHEHVYFKQNHYGTLRTSWDTSYIFIMSPSGIAQLSSEDRLSAVVIYLDIDQATRRERLEKRVDNDAIRRVIADEADFANFDDYDIRVQNGLFKCNDIVKRVMAYQQ